MNKREISGNGNKPVFDHVGSYPQAVKSVGAFLWGVEVEDASDGVPEAMDGALCGFSQVRF
jgi:hypothetical protein